MSVVVLAAVAAFGQTRESGVQISPGGRYTLISKDVGAERWAISLNDDATVTGNVFYPDGRAPAFVWCADAGSTDAERVLSCMGADACALSPCVASSWSFVADVTVPQAFFAPPQTEPSIHGVGEPGAPLYLGGLSGDGGVVIGGHTSGHPAGLGANAFRWTLQSGTIDLIEPRGWYLLVRAVSRDGSRIAGEMSDIIGSFVPSFVWSGDVFQTMPLDGDAAEATPLGMSRDGRVVVGSLRQREAPTVAWWWTEDGGFRLLPAPATPPGVDDCGARDVSDDGMVVVGSCNVGFRDAELAPRRAAVRWDVGGGAVVLALSGELSPVAIDPPCTARAVSADGSVVAGACGGRAWRWHANGSAEALPPLADDQGWSEAWDLSADGAVVVGTIHAVRPGDTGTPLAVRWSGEEVRSLRSLVGGEGRLADWPALLSARNVSDDGAIIAGFGRFEVDDETVERIFYAKLPTR